MLVTVVSFFVTALVMNGFSVVKQKGRTGVKKNLENLGKPECKQ